MFRCRDGVREHARNHEQQEQVTEAFYVTVDAQNGRCDDSCIYQDKDKHYHCNWVCNIIVNYCNNNTDYSFAL